MRRGLPWTSKKRLPSCSHGATLVGTGAPDVVTADGQDEHVKPIADLVAHASEDPETLLAAPGRFGGILVAPMCGVLDAPASELRSRSAVRRLVALTVAGLGP